MRSQLVFCSLVTLFFVGGFVSCSPGPKVLHAAKREDTKETKTDERSADASIVIDPALLLLGGFSDSDKDGEHFFFSEPIAPESVSVDLTNEEVDLALRPRANEVEVKLGRALSLHDFSFEGGRKLSAQECINVQKKIALARHEEDPFHIRFNNGYSKVWWDCTDEVFSFFWSESPRTGQLGREGAALLRVENALGKPMASYLIAKEDIIIEEAALTYRDGEVVSRFVAALDESDNVFYHEFSDKSSSDHDIGFVLKDGVFRVSQNNRQVSSGMKLTIRNQFLATPDWDKFSLGLPFGWVGGFYSYGPNVSAGRSAHYVQALDVRYEGGPSCSSGLKIEGEHIQRTSLSFEDCLERSL